MKSVVGKHKKTKHSNTTSCPLEGKTLQDILDQCQRCYSTSRMWSRLLPLQMKKGDFGERLFLEGGV